MAIAPIPLPDPVLDAADDADDEAALDAQQGIGPGPGRDQRGVRDEP